MVKGENMKKLSLVLTIAMSLFGVAYGADMCVRNDTVLTVLDPSIAGGNGTSDATYKTWSVPFSYGTLSGIAGCYATNDTATVPGPDVQSAINATTTGARCYCKMLRPAKTPWVLQQAFGSNNYCGSNCMSVCAGSVRGTPSFRASLFSAIIQK